MLICFFYQKLIVNKEFVPPGQTVNAAFYVEVLKCLGGMCEGSDLIIGGTTNGCSTTTILQPMLPCWLDDIWPIKTCLWCHILPTRPALHPATFSYFQNWKWSLRGEDFRRSRKFKQNRRPSWTRYEKMTSKNASKTSSAAGIVVKPQKGTTLKVMPAPNV